MCRHALVVNDFWRIYEVCSISESLFEKIAREGTTRKVSPVTLRRLALLSDKKNRKHNEDYLRLCKSYEEPK